MSSPGNNRSNIRDVRAEITITSNIGRVRVVLFKITTCGKLS